MTPHSLLPALLIASAGLCFRAAPAAAAATAGGTRYYVACRGDDSAAGTRSHPFRSINRALAAAHAGDTVFVSDGTYYERIVFPRSGKEGAPIVLAACPGEYPAIRYRHLPAKGRTDMILIRGCSHITVEGLSISSLVTTEPGREVNGITVEGGATGITLRRNHIHHIRNEAPRHTYPSAHAILILGNTAQPLRHITVEDNCIHDCVTGTSEAVTVNGYVDGFRICGNEIYRCSNIAIDAAGGYSANPDPAHNYARNGVICCNTIYDIDNGHGQLAGNCGAIAIYADGSRNITIERNRIHACDRGIGIVSENDAYPTTGCTVRNNIVTACRRTGIYMGGYLGYTGGGTEGCAVVNNTLCGNNRVRGAFGEVEGELRLTENCRGNIIAYNLVCTADTSSLFVHKYTATGSGNRFEGNVYSGPAGWLWQQRDGKPLRGMEAWRTACGGDSRGTHIADTVFAPVPGLEYDFTPPAAIAPAASTLPAALHGHTDFAGRPRTTNGTITAGALQPRTPGDAHPGE